MLFAMFYVLDKDNQNPRRWTTKEPVTEAKTTATKARGKTARWQLSIDDRI